MRGYNRSGTRWGRSDGDLYGTDWNFLGMPRVGKRAHVLLFRSASLAEPVAETLPANRPQALFLSPGLSF